jgi:hypothetical protein
MRRVALGTGSTAICQREHVGIHLNYAIAIETKTHLASRTKQTPNTNVGSEWKQTRGVASCETLGRPARTPLLARRLQKWGTSYFLHVRQQDHVSSRKFRVASNVILGTNPYQVEPRSNRA